MYQILNISFRAFDRRKVQSKNRESRVVCITGHSFDYFQVRALLPDHTLFADRCRISIAQLGNSAGIIGAAGLAMV